MDTIKLTINGVSIEAPQGSTILEAAQSAGIRIPTLCYWKGVNEIGACRVCVVEVKGARSYAAACVHPATDGMEVETNTPNLRDSRRQTIELMLSNHKMDCLSCRKSLNCELQTLAKEYDVYQHAYDTNEGELDEQVIDVAPHLVRDNSKCVLCRRCESMCKNVQHVGVIAANNRGFDAQISTAFDVPLESTPCVSCGQCVAVCPTGALLDKDDTQKVWDALADDTKHVVVAPAPAVRAQLGECFGRPIGTNVEGQLVTALRRMGFDRVFDVSTAADFTIMEEGTEFLSRFADGNGPLPLITSCSPGWVKFCEHYYPEMIPNLSSCKSPQAMLGALTKTYYAEKEGIDPKDIFVVNIMPCTAKKFEITRPDLNASGHPDVDVILTTRELGDMIKKAGIDFNMLPEETFDPVFGVATGAAHIFGRTGGVMEAALRTVSEVVTGKTLDAVDFKEVRGVEEEIKEAEYDIGGKKVKVAVTSGIANAKKLLDMIKSGEKEYHFVEIMGCSGGCVNGGGQPTQSGYVSSFTDLRVERAKALDNEDKGMALRKSHESPIVKEVYENYLEKPGSHKAHDILHTTYVERTVY